MSNKIIVKVLGAYLDPEEVVALDIHQERDINFGRVDRLYAHLKSGTKVHLASRMDGSVYHLMDLLSRILFDSPDVHFKKLHAIAGEFPDSVKGFEMLDDN